MSITQANLIAAGKAIAQDNGADSATGIKLLLNTGDYDQAVDQALAMLDQDRPNLRVYDYTVVAAGFRFPLNGGSAILPTSGLNAWVDGSSRIVTVWWPYDAADQATEPIDGNAWRTRAIPDNVTALEFLADQPSVDDVIRLEYTAPHTLDAADATLSSPRAGDLKALKILTGAWILILAANKLMQNTGNTGLPSDVVDRRTQADVARSLAKDLMQRYQVLVGKGPSADIGPASGFLDLDADSNALGGFLWHPSFRR